VGELAEGRVEGARWIGSGSTEVESQTQKATQLPGVSRQQLTPRPAKRAPAAIAGRIDEQAGGRKGVAS
jgi:hypothetical protein